MGIKTIFEILDAWHTERKKHNDKTFKQWLKHVGGLWTSKEEWKKIGSLETWKPVVKDTGKGIGKMFIVKVITVIILIILANLGID